MSSGVKRLNTITLLSLCIMIFVLPFSKSMVEVSFVIALISWALKRILSRKPDTSPTSLFKPVSTPLNLPLYLFALLGYLSMVTSISIFLSLEGLFFKMLEGVLIYFIAAETINDRKKLNLVLVFMASSILLTCVDGIFQYVTGRDFIRNYHPIYNRIQASFGDPNSLGGWLAVMFPLILCFGITKRKHFSGKIARFLIWVLICMAAFCLTMTYSRGAGVGTALALFFLGVLKKNKFLIVAIPVVVAVSFVISVPVKERLLMIWPFTVPSDIKGRLFLTATSMELSRVNLWREALSIMKDFPIFGCGLNTYSVVAPGYKTSLGGGYYAHNSYLQMAAEMGVAGLAAFIWMLIRLFKASLKSIKAAKDGFYSDLLTGLSAGMLAFLVHSFFDVHFYALQLAVLMWFIMGLIIAVWRIASTEEDKQVEDYA